MKIDSQAKANTIIKKPFNTLQPQPILSENKFTLKAYLPQPLPILQ